MSFEDSTNTLSKILGVQIALFRQAKKMDSKRNAEDPSFEANFAVQITHLLAIFGFFSIFGYFWVDTRYVGWS